jgi:hypothetical protein
MGTQGTQEGADLAWITTMGGQTESNGCGQQSGFIAAGGFADDEGVGLKLGEQAGQGLNGVVDRLG